eukprot:CAMPEP_0115049678 /NCGR_PEP_ID=MMETSP0227-20121206/1345_1 /TAXON_ID=89957 /ORGANISM="Polarella glacialis, Strain CCMP 1383" /LENGTH=136 /DNA_ID=CAMNT_0002433415 /DNA_START=72 /DNA_END=482 /DNA_ORIENTATION=-
MSTVEIVSRAEATAAALAPTRLPPAPIAELCGHATVLRCVRMKKFGVQGSRQVIVLAVPNHARDCEARVPRSSKGLQGLEAPVAEDQIKFRVREFDQDQRREILRRGRASFQCIDQVFHILPFVRTVSKHLLDLVM